VNVFNVVVNLILVLATVWFAWQASKSSAEAASLAKESVGYAADTLRAAR
jgi:hypothetical protein